MLLSKLSLIVTAALLILSSCTSSEVPDNIAQTEEVASEEHLYPVSYSSFNKSFHVSTQRPNGIFGDALIELNTSVASDSQNSQAWLLKGMLHDLLEHPDSALFSYHRTLDVLQVKLHAGDSTAANLIQRAQALYLINDRPQFDELLPVLRSRYPDHPATAAMDKIFDRPRTQLIDIFFLTPKLLPYRADRSIYGPKTISQIVDHLRADTMTHRDPLDASQTDVISKHAVALIKRIERDGDDASTLFPGMEYDQVIVNHDQQKLRLKRYQVEILLNIINDPTNFTWGECGTWMMDHRYAFVHNGSLIKTLDVGCEHQFRSDHTKMKFGLLNGHTQERYLELLRDIGIK